LITARKTTTWVLALGLLLALCVLALGKPAEAASVEPVFVAGNPTCEDLGYANGFKVDPPNSGTYHLPDGINTVTVTTADGVYFDWSSTLGMDAVIVKGGPNANAYVYDPPTERKSDTGLHSPINPNNSNPFGLSHIEFCYDYEVDVTKTAETSLDRTYTWDIVKSADKTSLELQKGEVYSLPYKIVVSNTSADSNWAVSGDITIKNPDPNNAAQVTDVTDVISGGINATVDCGGSSFSIPANGTKTCTYNAALPDGTNRTNTATVTTSGKVGGGSGTADVKFDGATTVNKIDDMIKVSDTYTGPGSPQGVDVSANEAPKTFTYNRDISFDMCGDHEVNNTASFVTNTTGKTGKSDVTVKVTIDCAQGCTLTIGYWKTHADPNSPRNDATQTLEVLAAAQPPITLGGLAVTNQNVVSLLSFSGDPSKPINKLYAQLLAAKLNIANGADGSAISTTIQQADAFLTGKQPNQNLSGPQRQTAVSLAAQLENFNSGGIGPGHCDEQ